MPTISAPLYEVRQSSARDASTVRLIILGALAISFFTLVLILTNALVQSVRERIGEMAVMQALGFQRATILSLILAEALLLFAAGALLGLVLSNVGFTYEIAGMRSNSDVLPMHTVITAMACVAACAFLSVLAPWRELSRCAVADALRRL